MIIWLFFSCSDEGEKFNSQQQNDLSESLSGVSLSKDPELVHKTDDTEDSTHFSLTILSDSSYCYIDDAITQNNETFLKVDYIQFFTFEEALSEAKKRGEADYTIEENGDTNYVVYNDYYIANDNPTLRTFQLTDSTSIELLEIFGDTTVNIKNTDEIMSRFENAPFIVFVREGKITRLEEVYTP